MIHNIAHRGASAYEPENTLRAFERAIAMGATMLELDVYLSSDGHPVILHDKDLSRTTNGSGDVQDLTVKQIKQFETEKGERVPTLVEVIELARGRVQLYIELKGEQTPPAVIGVLRATAFVNEAVVGSFHPRLPQQTKQLEPKIRTSALIRGQDREASFIDRALAIGANYVHPCWERVSPTPHKLLTPALISDIRRQGLGIIVWHEERPSELRQLVQLKVDGICTNTPDILTAILQEKKGIL
jgi:glycerophosphoryl diester phosphodiesterase